MQSGWLDRHRSRWKRSGRAKMVRPRSLCASSIFGPQLSLNAWTFFVRSTGRPPTTGISAKKSCPGRGSRTGCVGIECWLRRRKPKRKVLHGESTRQELLQNYRIRAEHRGGEGSQRTHRTGLENSGEPAHRRQEGKGGR